MGGDILRPWRPFSLPELAAPCRDVLPVKPRSFDSTLFPLAAAVLAGFSIPTSTALLNLSVLLLVVSSLAVPATRAQLRVAIRQPLVIGCLVFFGAFTVGLLWTPDPWGDGLGMLGKMRAYALAPFLFAACLLAPVRRGLLIGFGVAALLSAVLSVGTALLHHPILSGAPTDYAVFHTHTYHNTFLGFLVCAIAAYWLSQPVPRLARYLTVTVALLCLFSIFFLVQGRTAQLLLLLQLVFLLMLWRGHRAALIALVGVAALVPALYFSSGAVQQEVARAQSDLALREQGNVDTSLGLRIYYWQHALALAQKAPLIGLGTGSYPQEYHQLTGHQDGHLGRANPHNDFLWVAAELGLMGFSALLFMLAAAAAQATRLPAPERWLGLLLLFAYGVSSLINSFFTDNITGAGFVLLACAAMAGPWWVRPYDSIGP